MNARFSHICAAACVALAAGAASDQPAGSMAEQLVTNLRVASVEVIPMPDKLTVVIDIDARNIHPGRDREVTFTPVVRSLESADSVVLPQFKVCGRNRYYSHLRNGDLADGDVIIEAGSKNRSAATSYTVTVPWQEWMYHSHVDMTETVAHCCDAPVPLTVTPVADIDLTPRTSELPQAYVALTGDSTVTRELEGEAYITFIVNRTELEPEYMNNPAELQSIYTTMDSIARDPDAIVTFVSFKGYASPEGSYTNNVRLAMGRTNTLREHVRRHYNFSPSVMHSDYEPENWEGLIAWLESNEIDNREAILDICRGPLDPDPRNEEIKRRFPVQYDYLLKNVYPWLRRTNYKIRCDFRVFDTIEELLAVYADDPTKLRPIDFTRIASTMEEGSPEYDEVYMKAVQVWPDDELANLNAANIMLKRGELTGAEAYLRSAGVSAEAAFARGALAARRGDLDVAITYMQQALERGYEPARDQMEQLLDLRNAPNVTYLLPEGVITETKADNK